MGRVDIDYSSAKKYSKDIAEVEQKIRKGKSKHNGDNLDTFNWAIEWATAIKGNSFQDIINGTAFKEQNDWHSMTAEEQVKDTMSRSSFILVAKKGRGTWRSSSMKVVPKEVEDSYRESIQRQKDERARYAAMPKDKRVQEVEDLLKELSKSPGFFAAKI